MCLIPTCEKLFVSPVKPFSSMCETKLKQICICNMILHLLLSPYMFKAKKQAHLSQNCCRSCTRFQNFFYLCIRFFIKRHRYYSSMKYKFVALTLLSSALLGCNANQSPDKATSRPDFLTNENGVSVEPGSQTSKKLKLAVIEPQTLDVQSALYVPFGIIIGIL